MISEVSWGIYLGNMPLNNLGPKAPTDHLLQEVARDGPVVLHKSIFLSDNDQKIFGYQGRTTEYHLRQEVLSQEP